jgi:tetratricopeptide (TPR) repeat protein
MTNTKSARIWEETITIPTYPEPLPDPNPMFFEKRVNQGASGRVYPNPFTDHLNHEEKVDQEYQAVFLENEYLQLMVLPRFGGRIHAALDKTNGYDFIYHQHVIKPALIGLFGSWLSGGMEFNWPLHHRPSTFMPVEYTLEESEDGSVTIWLSEHEPLNRMQGMVGVCVYPGRALIELKVQVFNRTPLPQPFLWWVNTAVHVNDNYQLIFPPDVESVTFHSRAFMAQYPVTRQKYAGLDWTDGVDISWPRNVANATSYFANASKYNFFGGYDHGVKGGIIHVANRHISPGKKLFTWGMGEFGSDWQGTLTDEDGPYIELMASAYSDNQPDFSWLQPYEYRTFSQFWYPIQQIGVVKNANQHLAVNLETDLVGVCATEVIPGTRVILTNSDEILLQETVDLEPGKPFIRGFARARINLQPGTKLQVLDNQGKELIAYTVQPPKNEPLPDTAKPPKLPHQIDSLEELYLTGLHVEQYLHFSLDPAPYWERALEIDPSDSRSNNALGRLLLRRGDFARAERLLRSAIQTLTRYNFNPYDGEPHYNLGLALAYQGSYDQAYDHFYKATWSYAWRSAGYYSLAQIDVRRGEYAKAIEHLDRSLVTNAHLKNAYVLKAALLRRMGETESALQVIRQPLEMDPLDHWAHSEFALLTGERTELTRILRNDVQNYLDLAFDYANSGMYEEASNLLLVVIVQPKWATPGRQQAGTKKAAFRHQISAFQFGWRSKSFSKLSGRPTQQMGARHITLAISITIKNNTKKLSPPGSPRLNSNRTSLSPGGIWGSHYSTNRVIKMVPGIATTKLELPIPPIHVC